MNDNEFKTALKESLDTQEPLVLSPHGIPISFFVAIDSITDESIYLKNPVPHSLLPFVLTSKSFSLHCGNYRLEAKQLQTYGSQIVFKIPDSAQQGVTRQMNRISYYNAQSSYITIKHPFDTQTELQRPLYDLSREGLSFRTRLMTPFIQPGREIPACDIYIKGKLIGSSSGRIIYVKQIFDLQGQNFYQVGMHLNQSIEVQL